MDNRTFTVLAEWDEEARVWVAQSEDVPGLVTEAESEAKLIEKLRSMVPELLELNKYPLGPGPFEMLIQFRREARISLAVAA